MQPRCFRPFRRSRPLRAARVPVAGSRRRRGPVFAAALLLAVVLLLPARPLAAQDPLLGGNPRITKLRLVGVDNVSESELRQSIETMPTECRSVVLRLFCAFDVFNDSRFFVIKRYLEDPEELRRDELRLRIAYWRRGYRDARVESAVEPTDDGVEVIFTVDEGPATRIAAVDVDQTRPVLSDNRLAELDLPSVGEPLDVFEVDSAQIRMLELLRERGFGNAEVSDTVALTDTLSGAVRYRVEPGRITTVGELVIRGNENVSNRTIRRLMDVRPGDVFRRSDLVRAQRRLYRSSLFRRALFEVPDEADTAKTVVITVEEAPLRATQLGVGVTTVDFVQTQAQYTRYNWLGGARRLDLRVAVGNLLAPQLFDSPVFSSAVPPGIDREEIEAAFLDPTWQVGADLTQPFLFSSRNSLGLNVFAQRRSVLGIVIDRGYGGQVSLTRRLTEDVPLSALYRFEETRVEAGDVYYCVNFGVCRPSTIDALDEWHTLSPLGARLAGVRTDDPFVPTTGYTFEVNAEHASEFTLSDYRYNRASAETVRYLKLGPGVLAARLRGGWVRPLSGTADALGVGETSDAILHPRKRFYAGGARSVRGYGENQLGPRILTVSADALLANDSAGVPFCTVASITDGSCNASRVSVDEFQPRPLGGNSVFEGNLEYRFPLFGNFGGAVFVDAATVGDRNLNIPTGARSAVTPGFGFRYLTPFGPVRLDLGIRPTLAETLPVITEIPGQDRSQIVQLDRTIEYDPVGESDSFTRKVFDRLQLHLSIGQAF